MEPQIVGIRCRPGTIGWLAVAIMGLLGLVCLLIPWLPSRAPMRAGDRWGFVAMAALSLLPTSGVGCYLSRTQIIAGPEGLRWSRQDGWQSVRWEDVRDYYAEPARQGVSLLSVETSLGIVRLSGAWTNAKAFCQTVQERARWAVAKDWGRRGERDQEAWPYRFGYETADLRWAPRILGVGSLLIVALGLSVVTPGVVRTARDLGWGWALGWLLLFGGAWLLTLLLLLAFVPSFRDTGQRRFQQITVDADGILFNGGSTQVYAVWSEVLEIYPAPVPWWRPETGVWTVETSAGSFSFNSRIGDAPVLFRVLRRFAANAFAAGRRIHPDSEDLLKGRQSHPNGLDGQVFHYRLRSNRVLAATLTGVYGLPILFGCMIHLLMGNVRPSPASLALPFLILLLSAGVWWIYGASQIRLTDDAFIQMFPLLHRTLRWAEVTAYTRERSMGVLSGRTGAIRFWLNLSDQETLEAEIRRRLDKETLAG